MRKYRPRGMSAEEEEWDEWMCRAMNPDGHIRVLLPAGWTATVTPDVSLETLMSLDRLAVLATAQYEDEINYERQREEQRP